MRRKLSWFLLGALVLTLLACDRSDVEDDEPAIATPAVEQDSGQAAPSMEHPPEIEEKSTKDSDEPDDDDKLNGDGDREDDTYDEEKTHDIDTEPHDPCGDQIEASQLIGNDSTADLDTIRQFQQGENTEQLWENHFEDVHHAALLRREDDADLWAMVSMSGGLVHASQCLFIFKVTDRTIDLMAQQRIGWIVQGAAGGFFKEDMQNKNRFAGRISDISLLLEHGDFLLVQLSGEAHFSGETSIYRRGDFAQLLYLHDGRPVDPPVADPCDEVESVSAPSNIPSQLPLDVIYETPEDPDPEPTSRDQPRFCIQVESEFDPTAGEDDAEVVFRHTRRFYPASVDNCTSVLDDGDEFVFEQTHVWNLRESELVEHCDDRRFSPSAPSQLEKWQQIFKRL